MALNPKTKPLDLPSQSYFKLFLNTLSNKISNNQNTCIAALLLSKSAASLKHFADSTSAFAEIILLSAILFYLAPADKSMSNLGSIVKSLIKICSIYNPQSPM